jgi:D-tyrosyl-tRNA(Tyr) deacylase
MRAVLQRVKKASVNVNNKTIGSIGAGLLILLGVHKEDTENDASRLAEKIVTLRIFDDMQSRMNLSLKDIKGEMLIVSQFTLYGDCRKGRRPSWSASASPEQANMLYQKFISYVKNTGINTATGEFQAMMDVFLVNDGPVTLLLDSHHTF